MAAKKRFYAGPGRVVGKEDMIEPVLVDLKTGKSTALKSIQDLASAINYLCLWRVAVEINLAPTVKEDYAEKVLLQAVGLGVSRCIWKCPRGLSVENLTKPIDEIRTKKTFCGPFFCLDDFVFNTARVAKRIIKKEQLVFVSEAEDFYQEFSRAIKLSGILIDLRKS